MSTTIEVIPTTTKNMTFGEVIELAAETTREFLRELGIQKEISFQAEIIANDGRRAPVAGDRQLHWSEDEYAWFSMPDVPGGTDAYCENLSDPSHEEDKWWFLDELRAAPRFKPELEGLLERSKALDRKWYFRRSAGQRAITNLCYAHLAAAVADLSNGIVFSNDSAWDYCAFPCSAGEFRRTYFVPSSTTNIDYADWAKSCIDDIKSS